MIKGIAQILSRIRAIAFNTFREAVRNRILHATVIFVILMIFLAIFVGELSFYENRRVFIDFGLFFISVFGVFIAVFTGVSLVYKEIEKRSIYIIVSKPVRRWEFLVGKYLGSALTLLVAVGVMSGVFLLLFAVFSTIPALLIQALVMIYAELCVVLAIASFFSSFSTPFLSGFFTLGITAIGHLSQDLVEFSRRSDSEVLKILAKWFNRFYDLDLLSLKFTAVHDLSLHGSYFYYATGYALFLIALFLFFGASQIQGRDFK